LLHIAPQVAFDFMVTVQYLANTHLLIAGQVISIAAEINFGLLQDFMRGGAPDPVDTGERDFQALVARQLNTRNTSHGTSSS
jgi:hypothetical protein